MSVNIVNQDGSLKKIAHGFPESKFNALLNDVVQYIETGDTASRDYEVGDVFMTMNGQLVRAVNAIEKDTTISVSDVEEISITELIAEHTEKLDDISDGANKVESSTTNGNIKIDGTETPVYDDSEIQDKIDETTTSASGNPISISGLKSNQLAVNPIITLEPIQAGSGTPSPVNERPISGYDKIEVLSCGKNLFDGNFVRRAFSNGVPEASNFRLASNDFIRVKPNTQYTFSATGSNLKTAFLWFLTNVYGSPSYIGADGYVSGNSRTITTPSNANYCIIGVGFNDDAEITPSQISNTQFEEDDEATTYVPYDKTTDLSESIGQTVYGLTHEVRTGKARVTWKKATFRWGDGSSSASLGSNTRRSFGTLDSLNDSASRELAISDKCPNIIAYDQDSTHFYISSAGTLYVFMPNSTDADTMFDVCYLIATPITIQLTPHEISLVKDYAYVSTNGTNISLDYHNGELASLADVSQLGETVNMGLGSIIDISNDISKESTVTDFFACGYRIGNIVTIHIHGTISNQYGNLAYIDQKHAPRNGLSSFPVNTTITDGDGYQVPSYGQIGSTGIVYVVNKGQSGRQTHVTATYIAN